MKWGLFITLVFLIAISAVAQTGGGFNLEQNVIGNGGWRSDGAGFTILGTMGQSNSGSPAAGGGFNIIDGLWATENQSVGSPFANISGRINQRRGIGIVRVLVTIFSPTTNLTAQTFSQPQGYYRFADIPTGGNYIITVSHPHFTFNPDSVTLFISQDRNNVDFVSIQ